MKVVCLWNEAGQAYIRRLSGIEDLSCLVSLGPLVPMTPRGQLTVPPGFAHDGMVHGLGRGAILRDDRERADWLGRLAGFIAAGALTFRLLSITRIRMIRSARPTSNWSELPALGRLSAPRR